MFKNVLKRGCLQWLREYLNVYRHEIILFWLTFSEDVIFKIQDSPLILKLIIKQLLKLLNWLIKVAEGNGWRLSNVSWRPACTDVFYYFGYLPNVLEKHMSRLFDNCFLGIMTEICVHYLTIFSFIIISLPHIKQKTIRALISNNESCLRLKKHDWQFHYFFFILQRHRDKQQIS